MPEKRSELMSKEAQERLIEGARKGGEAEKHFTQEGKSKQIEGARKGGKAETSFPRVGQMTVSPLTTCWKTKRSLRRFQPGGREIGC